jgi:hypothetical protein
VIRAHVCAMWHTASGAPLLSAPPVEHLPRSPIPAASASLCSLAPRRPGNPGSRHLDNNHTSATHWPPFCHLFVHAILGRVGLSCMPNRCWSLPLPQRPCFSRSHKEHKDNTLADRAVFEAPHPASANRHTLACNASVPLELTAVHRLCRCANAPPTAVLLPSSARLLKGSPCHLSEPSAALFVRPGKRCRRSPVLATAAHHR